MKSLYRLFAPHRFSRSLKLGNSRQRRLRFDHLEDRRMLAIDGLIAHWSGDGSAADSVGGNDGVLQTAQIDVSGQTLDEALFSGSDDITLFLAGKSLRELLTRLCS